MVANVTDNSIDHEVLGELRDMAGDMFHRIIAAYLADGANYILQIENAVVGNDLVGVQRAAHALKSASGQVGAMQLQKLLAQLEAAAENNSGGVKEIFNGAKNEYEAVRADLSQMIK
jgi:HPt (histidine-containing phosphotransfer) domain-containing protein